MRSLFQTLPPSSSGPAHPYNLRNPWELNLADLQENSPFDDDTSGIGWKYFKGDDAEPDPIYYKLMDEYGKS
ncbi:MAG: hypothetical protein H0T78_09080 [Longispora sp.]|nr:hypothetical protein [Longispora sp. (in: high G+C Gram-positive bacteria)]